MSTSKIVEATRAESTAAVLHTLDNTYHLNDMRLYAAVQYFNPGLCWDYFQEILEELCTRGKIVRIEEHWELVLLLEYPVKGD